jgi:alanyl-tRNA synthetase
MTDEIFRGDGYQSEFEAHVVSVEGDEVKLDCTAFYPGGGGQVCDTGEIRGQRVTEVCYKGDDIVHKVPGNDLKVGEKVWCSVDWDRRFDLMQGHTGEHLLFCSLKRQCEDLQITKIFISPESKYVIVNHDIEWSQIGAALKFANQAIKDNLPVTKSIMDRDDPELEKVRIKLDRIAEDEQISVVAIGDIDLSACSGVHVMETAELEMLTVVRKVSAGKDGVTIEFKVGSEAKDAANATSMIGMEIVDCIGCKASDAPKAVANMKKELEADRKALKEATKAILDSCPEESVGSVPVQLCKVPGGDRNIMTEHAEAVKSRGGVAVYMAVGETVSVMVASGTSKVDCKRMFSEVLAPLGGRGGGKPDFAQGGIQDASKADEAMAALGDAVRSALL